MEVSSKTLGAVASWFLVIALTNWSATSLEILVVALAAGGTAGAIPKTSAT
jgi:hypothetical protein